MKIFRLDGAKIVIIVTKQPSAAEEVSVDANWTPTRSLVDPQLPSRLLHAKANPLIPPALQIPSEFHSIRSTPVPLNHVDTRSRREETIGGRLDVGDDSSG